MKYLLFMFILSIFTYGEPASKDDIKLIIEQMDKRFDAMQSNMDKRFEQVDKRFEIMQSNMDRRFETVFDLIYILMGLVFASPFIAVYLRDKKEAENKKYIEIVQGILFALKKMAKNDKELSESLKFMNI